MPDLRGQRIRDTYHRLLQLPGEQGAGPVALQTGDGDPLPVSLSADTVAFTDTVDFTGATVVGLVATQATYTHDQQVAAVTWTVTHNLGRFPGVSVVDSAGSVCVGDVRYLSDAALTVTFSAAFAGKAYLN